MILKVDTKEKFYYNDILLIKPDSKQGQELAMSLMYPHKNVKLVVPNGLNTNEMRTYKVGFLRCCIEHLCPEMTAKQINHILVNKYMIYFDRTTIKRKADQFKKQFSNPLNGQQTKGS